MLVGFELCALRPRALRALLGALVEIDLLYLQRNPSTPRLYDAGVRYARERFRRERFRCIGRVLHHGEGDCEDLAAWRVAELRAAGEPASIKLELRRTDSGPLFHVMVRRADGRSEDPSKRLGML